MFLVHDAFVLFSGEKWELSATMTSQQYPESYNEIWSENKPLTATKNNAGRKHHQIRATDHGS